MLLGCCFFYNITAQRWQEVCCLVSCKSSQRSQKPCADVSPCVCLSAGQTHTGRTYFLAGRIFLPSAKKKKKMSQLFQCFLSLFAYVLSRRPRQRDHTAQSSFSLFSLSVFPNDVPPPPPRPPSSINEVPNEQQSQQSVLSSTLQLFCSSVARIPPATCPPARPAEAACLKI